jgi:hypothetical protein
MAAVGGWAFLRYSTVMAGFQTGVISAHRKQFKGIKKGPDLIKFGAKIKS